MRIMCSNKECASRNRPKSMIFEEKDLLKIGDSYKCQQCRGMEFILLIDDGDNNEN